MTILSFLVCLEPFESFQSTPLATTRQAEKQSKYVFGRIVVTKQSPSPWLQDVPRSRQSLHSFAKTGQN